ncbi:MAG: T9SS type A sorting domain-containing protein [Lishizhenia sp.]|nr:T9SS type A sorting domain-containing protein [Lishizhenia sp.]
MGTNSIAQDLSIDNSFGLHGNNAIDINPNIETTANSLLQQDGKLVVVCKSIDSTYLVRFNANGALDNSFAQNGVLNLNISPVLVFDPHLTKPSVSVGLIQQRDGKLVVSARNRVMRLLEDGSLDPLFGSNGITVIQNTDGYEFPYFNAIVENKQNKLLVIGTQSKNFNFINWCGAGIVAPNTPTFLFVALLTPDGNLDPSFGVEGVSHPYPAPPSSLIADYKVQADGKVVLLTNYPNSEGTDDFGWQQLYRFNGDGSIDNSFQSYDPNTIDHTQQGYSIDITLDGKIICAGRTTLNRHYTITRYNADGSMDNAINTYYISKSLLKSQDIPSAISIKNLATNDFIVTAVDKESDVAFEQYRDTAVIIHFDENFNLKHMCEIGTYRSGKGTPSNLQVQDDGKILISGIQRPLQQKQVYVARFNAFEPQVTQVNISSCHPISIGKQTFSKPGIHYVTLTNQKGCDSLVVINLDISPIESEIMQSGNLLTALPAGYSYQWIDCNTSTPILGANSQFFRPDTHGSYAVIVSSDNCSQPSRCIAHFPMDVYLEYVIETPRVSPNPSNGQIQLAIDPASKTAKLEIINTIGQVVYEAQVENQREIPLNLNIPGGVYMINIYHDNGTFESQKIYINQ